MFNYFRKELDWGGRKLILETGKMARQADGAVLVSYGDTIVLCTAVGAKSVKPGQDFFPLTVNYQEKAFAAGKIPGGFFKREGRPSENETLVSRLIDRPIRPLFPDNFRNEVQVVATVLSHDMENDPDIVALIGCSAALTLSGIPFFGPVAAARVGYENGEYVLNPTIAQIEGATLDLVLAGTAEGVLMVESEARELSEEIMLGAVDFGHAAFQPVIQAIIELAEHAAKEPWTLSEPTEAETALKKRIDELGRTSIAEAYKDQVKQDRYDARRRRQEGRERNADGRGPGRGRGQADAQGSGGRHRPQRHPGHRPAHRRARHQDRAPDRRRSRRPAARPRQRAVHPRRDAGAVRGDARHRPGRADHRRLEGEYREHFMLHYNFPPFSVGEAGRMGSPGRREIGHGKLAWRAVHPLLPAKADFPYTLRVVSEILESNGSSSMATVCGTRCR